MSDHQAGVMKWVILVIIALCYLGSFLLPAFDADASNVMYGFEAFFFAPVSVIYLPAWLANPSFLDELLVLCKGPLVRREKHFGHRSTSGVFRNLALGR